MLKPGVAARAEALSSLANRDPKELLMIQSTTGKRLLHHIYQQCCISGLISIPKAEDDVQRLHALFDLAQQYGLASVIVDYILDVCSDETLTSRWAFPFSKAESLLLIIHLATYEVLAILISNS